MKGNMMEWGLTIPKLINFAEENFADNTFVSRSADGSLKSYKYGHSLQNSRKIAGFLKNKIGINLTDRVATIAWNDSYHLETYFAAIGMGAVLHTINPRLFPEQLIYIINHAEDCCIRKNGVMNEGEISTRMGLTGNPDIAESTMVNRDLELAQLEGSVLHVPHVSTAKAMNHIRRMKKEYKHLSAEVTPHHLYFNDEALVEYDTNLKVAPPIRTEHDRRALIKALKDDVIDCIATDHAPHTIEEKERTFDLAPFGMIGLESCFGVVYQTLVKESGMALGELIPKLTVNPRVVMGFQPDLFKPGIQAEISVIDTEKEWVFKKSSIQSRSGNSPFLGKKLTGKIQFILSKGIITEIT